MKYKHIIKTILPALLLLTAVAGGNGAWAQSHPNIGSISYNSTLGAYAIYNINHLKDLSVYVNGEGTYSTGGTETTPHNCSGLIFKQTTSILCNNFDTIRTIGTYANITSTGSVTATWRPFMGTYDGQGYIIDALKVKNDRYYSRYANTVYFSAGFFGAVDDGAVLTNIRLVNPSINNVTSLQAIMSGNAKSSRIPVGKWYSNLNRVHYNMAGIVGDADGNTTIENCYVFNPVFSLSHDDSVAITEISTYDERVLDITIEPICIGDISTTVTGCSEVYVVRAGSGVSFADNSVPSNVGFTYSGSRFYKPGSAIAIHYTETSIGYNLGFSDGAGHNIPFSGSVPNYTLTSINKNSLITPTYTPITYQLSYDNIDDATFITPNPSTYTIETETFTLNRPSREGYTFLGWVGTDLPRATKEVTIPRGSMGDRQYTAQWVEGVEPIFEVRNQNNTFIIKRDVTTTEQTVYYRTVALTAIAGQHFTQTSGTVTFAVGDSTKNVTVYERTPNNDAYKYQTGTSRTYRFEVLDDGGFELAHKDRTITSGTNVPSSGVFNIKNVTIQTSEYTADDRGYDNNGYKSVGASSYCTSGTQAYLGFLNAQLRMTLSFDAKENDDAYEYLQILFDNTSTCDNRSGAGNGNPGTPNLSRYMAGFEMNTGSKDDSYKSYTFPVTSVGSDASATNPWGYGTAYPLKNQKFKSGSRASDGRLIVPTGFSTIVLRLNASGSSGSDEWAAKNVKAHIQAIDGTAPTRLDNPVVNPGLHAKGNMAYISVPFNEIVTVTGTPILNTSWGTLKYYAGSGTNVLTFADPITATEGTRLQITSCTNYSNIKDLAGNPLNGSISYYGFNDVVTAAHDYNITYTLNGGTATPANPATYNYSTPAFTLTNPARAGYTFNGWTGSDLTEASMSVTVANHSHGDKRFIANWTPITYNLTYNLAGGSADNPATYTIETPDFTLANPTRDHYDFAGWTGTGLPSQTMNATIRQGSTGNRTYTATWTPTVYTITYNLNGGSATNLTSYTIESANFTLVNPTRTGYDFAGWTGTGLTEPTMSVTIARGTTGNLEYEAQWTEHTYSIHFEANVSGGIPVVEVNPDLTDIPYSSHFNLPSADEVFTRTGYYLDRWTTEPNGIGTVYTDGQEVSMLTAEQDGTVTLYAQWEVIEWEGHGNEDYPYIITYASQLVELANGDSYLGQYFKLGNDIDMAEVGDFTPIGLGTFGYIFTSFQGHFDGDGKTIRNLTVNRPDDAYNGLFGYVEDGSVRNVVIDNANVSGSGSTGCVVGTLYNGTVSRCIVKNSMVTCERSGSGAIVGNSNGGHIDSNYYYKCVLTHNGVTSSVNIGVNGTDYDGARSVHSLTLPAHVTASSDETVVIDDVTYYASNVDVTLNYTDLPRHFDVSYSYNDGSDHALVGNRFTMPAADVTVSASISPDLATWWHADENHDGTTEAQAYIISDTTGLNLLATLVKGVDGYPGNNFYGQYFKLDNDIVYSHTTDWDDITSTENNYTPIGQYYKVNGLGVYKYFGGNFDGDYHTISGIRMYKNSATAHNGSLGLFGETTQCTVKNVTLSDARITGKSGVGGIVGYLGGTVENCHVTNSVAIHAVADSAIYHGGIAGGANGSTISGCSSAATLTVAHGLTDCYGYGGILGGDNCVIHDCFVYGATIPHLHYTSCCEDYDGSGAIVGKINGVSSFRNNYYYGVTIGNATTGIGIGHEKDTEDSRHDFATNDAAVPIYSVTLGEHVTALPATTMAFDNKVCYKTGTDVTLQSEGCIITGPYTVTDAQGNNIAVSGGNVFTMPACDVTANASLMSGSGTEQDPYIISTPEELVALSTYTNAGYSTSGKHFLMANDIDMSGVANFAPIGRLTSNDCHPFHGTFDGGDYTIKHLTIDDATGLVTGLFGIIENACVKRLTLDNASIRGAHKVGGIVGQSAADNIVRIDSCRVNNSSFYILENAPLGAIVCKYSFKDAMNDNYYYNCSVNDSHVPTGIGTSDGDKAEHDKLYAMPITDLTFEVEAGQWQAIAMPFIIDGHYPFSTDLTEGVYDLLSYNEPWARWNDCRNDENFIFENGRGYIYRSATSGTRTMQGVSRRAEKVAVNGAGSLPNIDLNASAYCSDAVLRGFNLLGNPNDAPIDLQSAQEYLAGYYTLTPDGTWQPHLLSDPIAAGQAFLVQVSEETPIYIPLQSGESKGVRASERQSALRFEVSNGRHSDVAYAMMDDTPQSLHKFGHMEEELPTLSIVRGDERYAIAALGDSCKAFPLTLQAAPGSYTISMGLIGDMGNVGYCHLIDKVAGCDIDLLQTPNYTFTQSSNQAFTDRFLVKLSPKLNTEHLTLNTPFAYQQGNEIVVTGEGTLEAYDVMGRKLFTREANSSLIIHHSSFPGTGVYILRLGGQSQKIVIK